MLEAEHKQGQVIAYKQKYYKVTKDVQNKPGIHACANCQILKNNEDCIPAHCTNTTRLDNTSIHYITATKSEIIKAFMLGKLK